MEVRGREKVEKRKLLTGIIILLLLTSQASIIGHAQGAETTSSRYRWEYNKNSYFNGPFFGVWVEFDPSTPHPDNQASSDEVVRSAAVPYNPNYGYAAVRQIDLSKRWFYYDPTGYYGVTPSATIEGIAGYVSFDWEGPPNPYNQGSSVPEEARDYPYPYGVALTNEDGEVLEWTSEGTTYDLYADDVETILDVAGVGDVLDTPESTGNIWEDAFGQGIDAIYDFFDFMGQWDESIAQSMREAFDQFLKAVGPQNEVSE